MGERVSETLECVDVSRVVRPLAWPFLSHLLVLASPRPASEVVVVIQTEICIYSQYWLMLKYRHEKKRFLRSHFVRR